MVDVPKYNTLATMAKKQLSDQGVSPVVNVPVFNVSAQNAGASGGVIGALGSAVENFALNSMAQEGAGKKNADYNAQLNQKITDLNTASGQIGALVGQIGQENLYSSNAFMQKIDTVKSEWLSRVPDDKKHTLSTLWGAIAYPHYSKIVKNEAVARGRAEQTDAFKALHWSENSALESAGLGDNVGMGANLDLYAQAMNSLVISGAISPEKSSANTLKLMGKMAVQKYIAGGDFLGAKSAINALKKDKKTQVFVPYADTYVDEQLALADKNSRYLNNLADLMAQKQTKSWKQIHVKSLANNTFDYNQAVETLEQNRVRIGEDAYRVRSAFLQQFSPQAILKTPVVADVLKDSNAILLDKNRFTSSVGGTDALKQSVFKRIFTKRLQTLSIAQRKDMELVQSIADDILPKVKFLDTLGGITDVSRENLNMEIDSVKHSFKTAVEGFWQAYGRKGMVDGWAMRSGGVYKVVDTSKMNGVIGSAWQSIINNQRNAGQKIKHIKALIDLMHTNKIKDTDDVK